MPPKHRHHHPSPRDHTNPLIWCAATICAVLAVAVIIAGTVLFIGYLVLKPRVPRVSLAGASLDNVYFDQASLLTVQATILIRAENGNQRSQAGFEGTSLWLIFRGQEIANLAAGSYEVAANSSVEFNYVTQSISIPLSPDDAEAVSLSLRLGVMEFQLRGKVRTRWRMWLIGSAKFWLHLDCRLRLPIDRSRVYPRCVSTYK